MPPKEEKEKPKQTVEEVTGEIIFVIILVMIFGYFMSKFTIDGVGGSFDSFLSRAGLIGTIGKIKFAFIALSNILSILFVIGIIYSLVRSKKAEDTWQEKLYPVETTEEEGGVPIGPKNIRWQRVIEHINSDNPSDWRLAILESDIILDDLLDKVGLFGNTIGDKLKMANVADFRTLNYAWEAHRIRNAIAHEGQDFVLTKREARRIVGLYETVFREFNFV